MRLLWVSVIDCFGMVVIKRINALEWLYAVTKAINEEDPNWNILLLTRTMNEKALQDMNVIQNENNLNIFKDFHHLNVKGHAINIRTSLNSDRACTHTQYTGRGIPISVYITYFPLNLCILLYYNKRNMIPVNLTRKILNLRLK